jgi:hypothetical protein
MKIKKGKEEQVLKWYDLFVDYVERQIVIYITKRVSTQMKTNSYG